MNATAFLTISKYNVLEFDNNFGWVASFLFHDTSKNVVPNYY